MRRSVAAILLALLAVVSLYVVVVPSSNALAADENGHTPALLLSPQRLRRLRRDRDRQTIRWLNFEKRVESVPDSPERGFELALYYAVTSDEARGREAVAWARAHPCDRRQVPLVLDWTGELAPDDLKAKLRNCLSIGTGRPPSAATASRDELFVRLSADAPDPVLIANLNKRIIGETTSGTILDPANLYALAEYLIVSRSVTGVDVREQNASFFSQLPKDLLLRLRPNEIEYPDWMIHLAALALVAVDPNLENSQFLQGWALEDRQMLREGPGVAYEFLWADPYLPGIAYENMDPWIYSRTGTLFARTGWETNACWIHIGPGKLEQENCPANWNNSAESGAVRGHDENWSRHRASFGKLSLIDMVAPCVDLPPIQRNEAVILTNLKPQQPLNYQASGHRIEGRADSAGMFLVSNDTVGKLCTDRAGWH